MCTIGGSSKVYSNFDFLKEKFPVLANFGELAEKYLYSDSNSCLLKLGMIGETIVNLIFIYDRIDLPVDNTSANRIHTLYREGVVTSDLADILHGLRKIRNKAVHENYASVEDGKIFIQMAYSLTEWFMQTYGDWNYQNKPFEMPDKNVRLEIVDKEKEQTEEEKLIAEASKVAAMALSVKKEERKSQAGKAMRQRVKSEAETRYLIDEQLRKVGWEVDTQKLRYSKGTRPEKGRNIAIAEWPTDSTVGKKGFADYALFIDERLVAIIEAKAIHNEGDTMPAVTDFDLVIIDEAHRGYILDKEMGEDELLYRDQIDYQSKYRSVVEYFDAIKIALTATPALQTTEIFGQPVYKYTYREAVIEGYLVDHDAPHQLTTKLSKEGIHYKKGDIVTRYDSITGEITNSELLDDELDFDVDKFNRQVITEPFNKAVLAEIARDIDPETPEVQGKTLIYAVDDQHADLIVKILKEIYTETGVDNDAIMKITGSVGGGNKKKIEEAIQRFKNERYPSIVVTVDLLTTGIDVPEITTLVFMRRVKSRILFEQMLGRATRLCPEIHKTHFEIYDPVGVYDSLDEVNTMKPVVVNPTATFTQLLEGLEVLTDEKEVQNQINQIIAKLQRKKQNMSSKAMEHFISLSGGYKPTQFIANIQSCDSPSEAKKQLLACGELFKMLDQLKPNGGRSVVISKHEDELLEHTRGYGNGSKPEDYLDAFAAYVKTKMDEIAALNIVCTRPKELTRDSLKSLRLTLDREGFTTQQLNTAISQMTNQEITADIISLIRRYAIGSALISHEARIKRAIDKLKKAHNFSKQELNWIARMEKYLMEESVLNVTVFDEDGRFRSQGGFNKINKVFGDKLENIVFELNEYLYDDGGRTA